MSLIIIFSTLSFPLIIMIMIASFLYQLIAKFTAYQACSTHTHLTALCPGLPRWASTRKAKPIWILLEQETVSGSGISWALCKSVPRARQITTPALHHSVFYRPDALSATQPTASITEGLQQLQLIAADTAWSVCLSVWTQPWAVQNGWTNWGAVWGMDLGGPKNHVLGGESDPPCPAEGSLL